MAGKTLIGGTSYTVSGGKTKVGGTAYSILKGITKVGGTSMTIPFRERLYLYRQGDECSDITGGWSHASHAWDAPWYPWGDIVRNSDSIEITSTPQGGSAIGLVTNNQIDLSGYTRVCAEYSLIGSPAETGNNQEMIKITNDNSVFGYAYNEGLYSGLLTGRNIDTLYQDTLIFGVNNYNAHVCIRRGLYNSQYGGIRMYKLWLE